MAWWTYARATKLPTPGAMEYGLTNDWLALHPLIGPGIGAGYQFRSFNLQNTQNAAQAALTGLGGLVHGQSALQPLSDPYVGDTSSAYNWEDVNS